MSTNTLTLNGAQAEIILDRLEAGDAITDALTDAAPGELAPWSRAEVDQEQQLMVAEVRDSRRPCEIAITRPEYGPRRNRLRREIIADTMNGSTWGARAEGYGDATPLELANIERSLAAIARKMAAIGIHVDVVTW